MHRLQELVRLHRMGTGAREVARLTGMSPNTERSYRLAFEAAGLLGGSPDALPELGALKAAILTHRPKGERPEHETSSIAEWTPKVEALLGKGLTARPIYDRLRVIDVNYFCRSTTTILAGPQPVVGAPCDRVAPGEQPS
jgi:hypothetical protein